MAETVSQHVQRSSLDAKIELFEFDLSIYGGTTYYYTNELRKRVTAQVLQWNGVDLEWNGDTLVWSRSHVMSFGGQEYQPLPIKSEGWQRTGRGPLPRPTLTVSNITGLFSYLNLIYDDLVGIGVRRTRTFAWALDGEPDEDPNAILLPIDEFVVARKTHEDNEVCQYELAAKMDLEGRSFPSRPMLQNACLHIYRVWDADAGDFDYTNATCPYTGSVYRNKVGGVVVASQDSCAKTLTECLARFGVSTDLGFTGFPGIDRVRS